MDHAAFLYLNPELCLSRNIHTVEAAKLYADALTPAQRSALDADLGVVPDDFEPLVYIADGGLALNVSLLDSVIRKQSVLEGLSQAQVDHNQEYADNLIQDVRLLPAAAAGLRCGFDDFMTDRNVMPHDRVRLLVDDFNYYKAVVASVDYNARELTLTPEINSIRLPADGKRYRLYSSFVADAKRIAVINYVRRATNRKAKVAFDPEFNLRLYQLLYPDSRLMHRDTAYVDYLGRQNTKDFRVGKEPDLILNKDLYIWPPINLSDVVVTGDATFLGKVSFCNDFQMKDLLVDNIRINCNISVGGGLTVSNDVRVIGNASFHSNATFSNNITVIGFTTLSNSLTVAAAAAFHGPVAVNNTLSVSSNLAVGGATALAGPLGVAGPAAFSSNVSVNSNLAVGGSTVLSGSLGVAGPAAFSSNVSVNSNLAVGGATALAGPLGVAGPAAFSSNVSVNSNLSVGGATALAGPLGVAGPASFSNHLSVNSNLAVGGATALAGPLGVGGPASFSNHLSVSSNLAVGGATTMSGPLGVGGPASFCNHLSVNSNLAVGGATSMSGPLGVGGPASFSSNVSVNSNLSVGGSTVLTGPLGVGGPASFSSNVSVNNNLAVGGSTVLSGPLGVGGPASFSNHLSVNSNLSVGGATAMSGPLGVGGPASFSNAVRVAGHADFGCNVAVRGDLSVAGGADIAGPLRVTGPAQFSNLTLSNLYVGDSMVIPTGPTAGRPASALGSIRYNTDLKAFEGFTDTAAGWSSLGGAIDGDRDTMITVEKSPGLDDDTIRMYTSNVERVSVDSNGELRVHYALVAPSGPTAARPSSTVGSIRYNTDLEAFEGFTTTSGWASLGGSFDGDRDTKITVEKSPGANDNTIRMYTSNVERMRITDTGQFLFNTDSNTIADDCDFVFNGKACFSNVHISGNLSIGNISSLAQALSVLGSVSTDLDPPFVEDFSVFRIPGTSNIGASVSVEEAGDFRVYAFATRPGLVPPGSAAFADPALFKRFYNKQVAAGHGNAFSVSYVTNTAGPGQLMDFSNVDVGMYFGSTDTRALATPSNMENYHVYHVHLLVEDLIGRKAQVKQYDPTMPLQGLIRNADVLAPTASVSNVFAAPNGGLSVQLSGVSDDGFGGTTVDQGFGSYGAPGQDGQVTAYFLALDSFQSFTSADEAFLLVDAGCNVDTVRNSYDPAPTGRLLGTYFVRSGYGAYSGAHAMSNFRYYTPYILLEDHHTPRNRTVIRMPDTVTLDLNPPVAGVAQKPFADYSTSNAHELVFTMSNVIEDTKSLMYTWAMASSSSFTDATAMSFASSNVQTLPLQPYQDLVYMPPLTSGEVRIGHAFDASGNQVPLDEHVSYTVHTVIVDSSNNYTYVAHPPCLTKDVTAPALQSGPLEVFQTVRSVDQNFSVTPSEIEVAPFSVSDAHHSFSVYLFCFSNVPPSTDVIKERLRDGVYSSTNDDFAVVASGGSGNTHNIQGLKHGTVISTGPVVSRVHLASQNNHGMPVYPVVIALDDELRDDTALYNGNAASFQLGHVSRTPLEQSGSNHVVLDEAAPELDYFRVSQSNARDPASSNAGIGHPLVKVEYRILDRHPARAWLYYSNCNDDVFEVMNQPDRLIDDRGLSRRGTLLDRVEVTASNGGGVVELHGLIEENNDYYFVIAAHDYHNNRVAFEPDPIPKSLFITPRDPVVVDFVFDVRDNHGELHAALAGRLGVSPTLPSASNTLSIEVDAQDRGRGGLDEIFLYYTDDPNAQPAAAAVSNLAVQAPRSSGSPTGGHVWSASFADAFVGGAHSPELWERQSLYLHVVAKDGYGNFSAVRRENMLHHALRPHGGLTYDTTPPVVNRLRAVLHQRNDNTSDTKIDIEFTASDSGGAGLARMYLLYADAPLANQTPGDVKRAAQNPPNPNTATSGTYSIDLTAGASNQTTMDLAQWSEFWVYGVCEDGDGNLSPVVVAPMTDNNGRTWDYRPPNVSGLLRVNLATDNTVKVVCDFDDSHINAPPGNSGIADVYMYYEVDQGNVYSAADIISMSGSNLSASSGGKQWYGSSPYHVWTPQLQESTPYAFYALAVDAQSNESQVVKTGIHIHGGTTYDLTAPTVVVGQNSSVYFTNTTPDITQYKANLDFAVQNLGAGGASLESVYLFYTSDEKSSPKALDVRSYATGTTPLPNNTYAASMSNASGTFEISGSNLSSVAPYDDWYFHIVAFDTDSEAVLSGALSASNPSFDANNSDEFDKYAGDGPAVQIVEIDSNSNNGKSYSLTPPQMSFAN